MELYNSKMPLLFWPIKFLNRLVLSRPEALLHPFFLFDIHPAFGYFLGRLMRMVFLRQSCMTFSPSIENLALKRMPKRG